jgi:hypothetical protein
MPCPRKGQASLFMVLGAVLIIMFGLIVLSQKQETNDLKTGSQNDALGPVTTFMETCLTDTIEEGIYAISSKGGYVEPLHGQSFESREVAIYLEGKAFSVPTLPTFENELAKYVDNRLPLCLDEFRRLSSSGYQIEGGEPSSRARVGENDITALVTYPLTVIQANTQAELETFRVSVPFDFKAVYKLVQDIMLQQGDDPLSVHYGFLAKSAYNNDYYFKISQIDADTLVYSLRFDSKTLDGRAYEYAFAVNYDWQDGESG